MKNITKADAKKLNQKQAVLVENVTENGKETINIYLNDSKKRCDVFYSIFKGNFKPSRKKDEVQKSYRILKLYRLMEEIGSKGAKEGVRFYYVEAESTEAQEAAAQAA